MHRITTKQLEENVKQQEQVVERMQNAMKNDKRFCLISQYNEELYKLALKRDELLRRKTKNAKPIIDERHVEFAEY